ncbi:MULTISPECIES: hypothetical protein [Fusobacterium]|uniref:hypothetical protein n=1 Tax=Fusobacterium TaxID=848 RepID=UPI000447B788|nr:hypothetical protein [Fusobacterium sp. OBRC1]EUB33007.1 hypothetical protein HMPREF1501_1659 [Fusobacterium sp. OBRC1]
MNMDDKIIEISNMVNYQSIVNDMYKDEVIIYFEGENNKKFYSNFSEIQHCILRGCTANGQHSCIDIKNEIVNNENLNLIAIIDGDFCDDKEHENIFKIDFYSIENIVLMEHGYFQELKTKLEKYYESEKDKGINLIKIRGNINDKRDVYSLDKSNNIHKQFHCYIKNKIVNFQTYIKYMDLKEVVYDYSIFRSYSNNLSRDEKNECKKYIETLFKHIKDKKLSKLFSKKEYESLSKILKQV